MFLGYQLIWGRAAGQLMSGRGRGGTGRTSRRSTTRHFKPWAWITEISKQNEKKRKTKREKKEFVRKWFCSKNKWILRRKERNEPVAALAVRADWESSAGVDAEPAGAGQHKLDEEEVREGGGGVRRELVEGLLLLVLAEDGMKRLSKEAARVLLLLLLLLQLLFLAERVVVRDQVREQLSAMMVVIFLPVVLVVTGVGAAVVIRGLLVVAALSLLPPDRSEMSLGGPVAEAIDIFSSSNSTGPKNWQNKKKANT